jgi:prepilin-type N-terminal cleavage/methylation domain-containing protein
MSPPQARGFTLIELLLVLAMVATLAAVALPRYQNYLQRARWSANLQAMNAAQTALVTCLQENTATDCASWAALGLSPADNAITLPHGRATLLADAAGFALTGNAQTRGCVVHLRLVSDDASLMQRWQTALQNNGASGCTRDSTGVAPATAAASLAP